MIRLRGHFGLERVVPVGDRGLPVQVRIEHLKRHPQLGWVSAFCAPQVRSPVGGKALRLSLFDGRSPAGFAGPQYSGERPVGCCNPLPAEERARKREELLATAGAALERIAHEAA